MIRRVRCAIYTRKSSDDGLEQDFNTLDAQREACEAYIASQRNEGWELLPNRYDDGGISGGHLDRPALRRLMAKVEARQVDQIVVYKIDRLTRSLADFAKLVEQLEARDASFVSVTQSFNTSTSMGRLTLNMLLSFAQFEREVTAERIRDKIAASKRKGLWMGGNVPLGYEPDGRTLRVNPDEANRIRLLYDLYDQKRSVTAVTIDAQSRGLRSKARMSRSGKQRGGHILSRSQVHQILSNPIYAGLIRHKDQVYEGQHAAIIDPDRWRSLQADLMRKSAKRRHVRQHRDPSPLAGKLFDEAGEKLTPSHTKKGERRYRYYISNALVTGLPCANARRKTWRIPALALEDLIAQGLKNHLGQLKTQQDDLLIPDDTVAKTRPGRLFEMVKSATLGDAEVAVLLDEAELRSFLDRAPSTQLPAQSLTLTLPFTTRRRGVEMKLVVGDRLPLDQTLLRNIAAANRWYGLLKKGRSFDEIAAEAGTSKRRIQQMFHLAFLAPDILRDVTQGTQPCGLTSNWLLRNQLPAGWQAQRKCIAAL